MSPYAALNPFIVTSVGENDLWNAASFPDVLHINSVQFGALKIVVEQVRAQRRSQVRFVRGAGGSGKSHLFARLHREGEGRVFYAYASNPPLQPETLEQFILSRFVNSLRHPARDAEGGAAPYSQLRLLAYALLKPVVEQDLTLPQLHDAWAGISLETRKEMIHQAVQLLEADHPAVPRPVLRCLLNILREDKEHLAAQWLSGASYLTENELRYLGVPEPLQRGEMGVVLQLFGKLAAQAGPPVVLVLDQLDLLITQPQFDEMQRLLFALIDQSTNWVVLIGLVAERFAMWDAALSQALRGRIGVPDSNAPLGFRLPVVDMLPVANEQKRQLLACRLETPDLVALRKKDGITSDIHPLLEEDVVRLTTGGAIFPRHLLAAAAEAYALRAMNGGQSYLPKDVVTAASTPVPSVVATARPASLPGPAEREIEGTAVPTLAKVPLAEKIDALFQKAIEVAKADSSAAASAVELGERTRDLIELMVAPPVMTSDGDIRQSYGNFDGSDRWFEWGGSRVRVVTTNAVRASLIAVLERVKAAAGDTLLLRHAVAPVSGQLTLELLNAYKENNVFHHVPASETATLAALGGMLAAQREGSYDQLPTEPPATREHVLAALRDHPQLRGLRLWELVQKAHAPKKPKSPASPAPSALAAIVRTAGGGVQVPPAAVVKPPPLPGAVPPAPPMAKPMPPGTVVTKPVAKLPSAPVAKPPPVAKLPPPS